MQEITTETRERERKREKREREKRERRGVGSLEWVDREGWIRKIQLKL